MERKIIIFIVALFVFLCAGRAEALIIEPTADATIFDSGYINHTGYPQAAGFSRGIVEFDTMLTIDSIENAIFNLNVEAMSGDTLTLGFFVYSADGVITGEDYSAGKLFSEYLYTGESSIQIDVTSILQHMSGNNYFGFNIRVLRGDGWVAFNSLEYPSASALYINEPVNAVPEPTTMLLFGTGLVGFAIRRRKI